MEAALLDFVLDVATSLFTDISQDFAQHPFECVTLYGTPFGFSWWGNSRETVVTNVERGTEQVTALAGSIAIASLQAGHIVLCPKYTRHYDAMQWYALDVEAVHIAATDCREQIGSTRHKVGNTVTHAFVDAIEWIGTYIDEPFPTMLRLITITYRANAPLLGCHYLHILHIGEAFGIRGHTTYRMPLRPTK